MVESLKAEQCVYLSTDFHTTPFVRSVVREFGPKGYALVTVILLTIGRNGVRTLYGQSFREAVVSGLQDVSQNLVDMVVRKMVKSGFLDRDAFHRQHVLTPPSSCIAGCVRDVFTSDGSPSRPYLFVSCPYRTPDCVSSVKTTVSSEETAVNAEGTSLSGNNFGNNVQTAKFL